MVFDEDIREVRGNTIWIQIILLFEGHAMTKSRAESHMGHDSSGHNSELRDFEYDIAKTMVYKFKVKFNIENTD